MLLNKISQCQAQQFVSSLLYHPAHTDTKLPRGSSLSSGEPSSIPLHASALRCFCTFLTLQNIWEKRKPNQPSTVLFNGHMSGDGSKRPNGLVQIFKIKDGTWYSSLSRTLQIQSWSPFVKPTVLTPPFISLTEGSYLIFERPPSSPLTFYLFAFVVHTWCAFIMCACTQRSLLVDTSN